MIEGLDDRPSLRGPDALIYRLVEVDDGTDLRGETGAALSGR
jgi:hypothetical protein